MRATSPTNLRLTTGRLYWLPTGESGWIDCGNCTAHQVQPEVTRAEHYKHENGSRRMDMSLANTLKPRRVFTFDEHTSDLQRLLALAEPATEVTQGAAVGLTKAILNADLRVGRTYDLGKQNVSNVVGANATPTALVENVDYLLDKGTGMVTILSSAKFGSTWTFTFNCAQVKTLNFDAFSRLLEQGSFKFMETDQHETVPLSIQNLTGQVYVTGWGDGDPEKFQAYTVEVIEI